VIVISFWKARKMLVAFFKTAIVQPLIVYFSFVPIAFRYERIC
jgi:hypothetical protein